MKKLFKTLKQIAVLILAIAFIGCEDDDVVLPKVVAGFTYTINNDTGTVTFINISENANTYEWDFGDNSSSTLNNPVKTYENGTYTITLHAKNVAGGSAQFQDDVTILIPEVATIPISFDGANTNYDPELFGGASFAIVDNPDPSGANPSASKVGAVTNSGAAWEGLYFDLGAPLSLETQKTIKMLFWSNAPIDVLVKLEEGTGADVEATASHGGTGWEEIYFTFDSAANYSRFTMFVDGPGTTAGTFYFDDVSQIDTADIPCPQTMLELPIDFDCNSIDYAGKIVGNVSFEVIDNPELSGINSDESKVGKITNVGANWENAFFNLDTAIDFTTDKGVKLKLFSDQALPVKLKFEDGTEGPVEADANHTGSGWEELTFTLTSTASYNDMILFVDGPGTAAGTFYIDDIEQVAGVVADPCEAETEQSLAGADFNLTFMADPTASIIEDGGDFEWVDNPDFDNDVNKSCKVGKITKLGNNPWDNNQIDLDAKLDFNANEGLKIKVWSAIANSEVRIKLEEIGNPGNNTEQFLTTSVTSGWEELTFPFTSGDSDKFNKIVIFFDLNANNTDTYYFDDLMLYGSGGGGGGACVPETMQSLAGADLDLTFMADPTASIIEDGGDFEWVDNPDFDNAVNMSCKVGKITKLGNNPWDNNQIDLDAKLDFNANSGLKIKVWSAIANSEVRIKLEEIGNPGNNTEKFVTTSVTSGWEELTFPFDSADSDKFNKIVIFFDLNANNTDTYYFDDLRLYSGGGGGGGTGGGCTGTLVSAVDFPVDFEACETFMATDGSVKFGDAISAELAANPSSSGINTSDYVLKVDKPAGANHWEGVQNAFAADFDSSLTFKVKIYTTKANVTYRFEISNDPNDNSVGNPAGITKVVANANEWTEVEVTFTGVPPGGHNNFVIKPDDEGSGTVSVGATHYFDDIRLE